MDAKYVHGYDPRESTRLQDQAQTLEGLLHFDSSYPAGSLVLEAGCGVGAQTVILARNSPGARIVSVDISGDSVSEAEKRIIEAGFTNVTFRQGDIFDLPFASGSFDHIFLCFVLEHLSDPSAALLSLKGFLKEGGSITVIEGDHGSTFFHPDNESSHGAIRCLVELQKKSGGNANIGRELYPLLKSSGYGSIQVSPRMVYVDSGKPELVEGFTRKTFTAMIEGVREDAIATGLIDESAFDEGVRGLYRTAEDDGVFCYTFFKATACKP